MPYTEKQKRLIRARAHGWKPARRGVHMSESAAKKMMDEMEGQAARPPVRKHKQRGKGKK